MSKSMKCNEWRSDKCLTSMYEMRPHLCDVFLITDDSHSIPAQRGVLAANLEYFNVMFGSNGGQYMENDLQEIHIKGIEGLVLNEIIKWCYTGCVDTTADNVQQLLSGAKMLDCSHVVFICCQFIESQINSKNVLGIYDFAELMGCLQLKQFTLNYIHNNFKCISCESQEFIQLTDERVAQIISSDLIDTSEGGESVILSALISWIQFNCIQRTRYLPSLIQHIRFPLFYKESLIRIEDDFPLIKSDINCKDLIIEAMKYHLSNGLITIANNARFRDRASKVRPEYKSTKIILPSGEYFFVGCPQKKRLKIFEIVLSF